MISTYDSFGKAASNRFLMFATAVAGERALVTAAGLPTGSLKSSAQKFRTEFVNSLNEQAMLMTEQAQANATPELSKRMADRFGKFTVDLYGISSQVVNQNVREAAFGGKLPIDALAPGRRAGAIGLLVQQRLAKPSFKVYDSAGRKWDGDRLVSVIARDFAYQTYIDAQFAQAIKDGKTSVTIDGQEFKLDSTWMERRDALFHINSSKVVDDASL